MKKVLALCILIAICLSFYACGGESGSESQEETVGISLAEASCEEALCGRWFGLVKDPETTESKNVVLVFNKDRSCTIGGEPLTWQYVDCLQRPDWYTVKAGDYTFSVVNECSEDLEEYFIRSNDTQFFKADHYRAVELTKENWSEYFELVDAPIFSKNPWGEVTSFELNQRWQIREKWGEPHFYSEMLADVELTLGVQKCTVNKEEQTYFLEGEIAYGGTLTQTLQKESGDSDGFGGVLWRAQIVYGDATVVTAVKALRVRGILYLKNQ